ncbi:MAG: restriction endonuclease [Bacteroidales bacterium]|nr:restriction endonuclease [Bacteroidales bacterium]
MNYWLHRITGGDGALEFAHPLLFNNRYLSIGWSDFSEDVFVKKIKERGTEYLDEVMQNEGYGLPRNRWNLFRFINEMHKDDIVLVPTWNEFSLFKIADDVILTNQSIDPSLLKNWNGNLAQLHEDGYFHNSVGGYVDLGFYRKVTPILLNIPREGYADQDLYSRMKIRQTNANITDLRESVEKAKESFKSKKPINLKEQIVEEAAPKLLSLIEKLTNDIKFENLVEWYLKSLGARIYKPSKNESATGDGDADRVGYFDNIKTAIMVQVKKHEGTTDDWAVQQIKAYKANHNYGDYHTQMWVISSCEKYSDNAIKLAEAEGVCLINGIEFAKMILDAGLEGLNI